MKFPLSKPSLLSESKLNLRSMLTIVVLVSVVGITAIWFARAAGFISSFEPEVASLSSGATSVNNGSASGGKYLLFGNGGSATPVPTPTPAPTPTPTPIPTPGPAPSGWPADYNTGYPHGLPGDTRTPVTLTPYTGSCILTSPVTINAKDITCRLYVRSAGVVIKNSRIRVSNEGGIYINDDNYHTLITDTEVDGQHQDNSAGGISLIGDGSYTCIRCNLHGSGDIIRINWGGVAVIDSWLHDPYCMQESCHNDIMQSTDGDCTIGATSINGLVPNSSDSTSGSYCLKIVHNRLENPHTQTSNILLKADQGNIHDVLVENNLFNGGGYTFYWYDSGYKISNGVVRNNRFRRAAGGGYWPNGGYFGPVATKVASPTQLPVWTNNVWDDNGALISL